MLTCIVASARFCVADHSTRSTVRVASMEDVFDSSPESSVIERVYARSCENGLYLYLEAALELPPQEFWNLRMSQEAYLLKEKKVCGRNKSAENDYLLRFVVLFLPCRVPACLTVSCLLERSGIRGWCVLHKPLTWHVIANTAFDRTSHAFIVRCPFMSYRVVS